MGFGGFSWRRASRPVGLSAAKARLSRRISTNPMPAKANVKTPTMLVRRDVVAGAPIGESCTMIQMKRTVSVCLSTGALALMVVLGAVSTTAQNAQPYEPQINQPGKDVQWVPTPPALVEKMLDLAHLTPNDHLVDLGSGDGVLVIAAARRGARARGIEYDGRLVELSKRRAQDAGVGGRTKFVRGDIFETNFSDASVITSFLLPSMNLRLRPTLLAMKPGTRIVANTFGIADWEPDETTRIEPCERWCTAMLWIVPARVGGTWLTPKGDLTLTQRFQFISGTLGHKSIENGRLRGAEISFNVGLATYRGSVDGDRMRISATSDGKRVEWTARPTPRP
jgi:Methyltransferase domain